MPSGTRDTVVSSERRDLCRTAGATNRGERGGMPVELLAYRCIPPPPPPPLVAILLVVLMLAPHIPVKLTSSSWLRLLLLDTVVDGYEGGGTVDGCIVVVE